MKSVKNFRYVEKTSAEFNEESYLAILHLSRSRIALQVARKIKGRGSIGSCWKMLRVAMFTSTPVAENHFFWWGDIAGKAASINLRMPLTDRD